MDIAFKLVGAAALVARLERLGAGEARNQVWNTMNDQALLLNASVKRHASGRPGPNVITGDYRRSWNTRRSGGNTNPTWTISTNKPQGPRLEYGFYGVDSLGRMYHQAPLSHVQPAVDEAEPKLYAAVQAALNGITL